MTPTNNTIRERSYAVMESDLPEGVTLARHRSDRGRGPTRWEKARLGILGAGLVGLVAETVLTHRR
jgi:hypothetical protein